MTFKNILLMTTISIAIAGSAIAAGSDSTKPPKKTKTSQVCEKGQVYDKQTKSCLDAKSELFNDDAIYEAARELAYDGQYQNAQLVLAAADNQEDPRILNYYGFTHRKLGNMADAMRYYEAALAVDPDYILARSYMGQGLVADGDLAGAKAQLKAIGDLGGVETWAYASLEKSINGQSSDY